MDSHKNSSEILRKMADTHVVGPWLATKLVDDLIPPKGVVICVSSTDTLSDAYRTLIQHKIQSAPVYDMKAKEYTSLIDINDILAATILIYEQKAEGQQIAALLLRYMKDANKPDPDVATLLSTENLFKSLKVCDITNLSERNPYVSLPVGSSLYDCVKLMVEKNLHRVPIVEKGGKLANLISQSSILDYLHKNKFVWEKDLGTLTMTELNLHNITLHKGAAIVSIKNDKTALQAFTLLHEKQLSGIPVVDDQNKLVATISVQDLKEIGADATDFKAIHEPLTEYLKHAHQQHKKFRLFSSDKPIHFHGKETLSEMFEKIHKHRVHRIFYVDSHDHLFGVVTLGDLLKFFMNH